MNFFNNYRKCLKSTWCVNYCFKQFGLWGKTQYFVIFDSLELLCDLRQARSNCFHLI